jgi:hypothetical protein
MSQNLNLLCQQKYYSYSYRESMLLELFKRILYSLILLILISCFLKKSNFLNLLLDIRFLWPTNYHRLSDKDYKIVSTNNIYFH